MTATRLFDEISIGDNVRLVTRYEVALEGRFVSYRRILGHPFARLRMRNQEAEVPFAHIVRAERLKGSGPT